MEYVPGAVPEGGGHGAFVGGSAAHLGALGGEVSPYYVLPQRRSPVVRPASPLASNVDLPPAPRKAGRVLKLPPPLRNKRNYDIPLPTDCDGLIFALEGRFNCGNEIVADAATKILAAVHERCTQILDANSEGQQQPGQPPNQLRNLIANHRLSSSQKLHRLRVLESSWVTSVSLPKIVLGVLETHVAMLQGVVDQYWDGTRFLGPPAEYATSLLKDIQSLNIEFETLTTLVELLQVWTCIWFMCGVLERPKKQGTVSMPKRRKKLPSVIVPNPPPPQPRGVGRPKLIPVISIGDFVDTLQDGVDLSFMRPVVRPTVYFQLEEIVPQLLCLWKPLFLASVIKAEELEALGDQPSFPIEPSTVARVEQAPALITTPLVDKRGVSLLANPNSPLWDKIAAPLFSDNEVEETCLETLKEVEFLVWKEARRNSTGSSNTGSATRQSVDTSKLYTTSTAPAFVKARYISSADICNQYPVVGLGNVLINALVSMSSTLIQTGAVGVKQAVINSLLTAQQLSVQALGELGHPQQPPMMPALYRSIGLHYFTTLLEFGRDHAMTVTEQDRQQDVTTPNLDFLKFLCDCTSEIMLLFGRYVALELFPSVARSTASILDALAPWTPYNIPVDVHSAKSAVILGLVALDELNGDYANTERLWYALLFCALGAAVAIARQNGFTTERSPQKMHKHHPDHMTLMTIINVLPENVRQRTMQLMHQRCPQLFADSGIIMDDDDDIDTMLSDNRTMQPLRPDPSSTEGKGPELLDTYDEKLVECQVEVLEDILYACTTIFLGLVKDDKNFAYFLLDHKDAVKKIAVLSRSSLFCQMIVALEADPENMSQWDVCEAPSTVASFELTPETVLL